MFDHLFSKSYYIDVGAKRDNSCSETHCDCMVLFEKHLSMELKSLTVLKFSKLVWWKHEGRIPVYALVLKLAVFIQLL